MLRDLLSGIVGWLGKTAFSYLVNRVTKIDVDAYTCDLSEYESAFAAQHGFVEFANAIQFDLRIRFINNTATRTIIKITNKLELFNALGRYLGSTEYLSKGKSEGSFLEALHVEPHSLSDYLCASFVVHSKESESLDEFRMRIHDELGFVRLTYCIPLGLNRKPTPIWQRLNVKKTGLMYYLDEGGNESRKIVSK